MVVRGEAAPGRGPLRGWIFFPSPSGAELAAVSLEANPANASVGSGAEERQNHKQCVLAKLSGKNLPAVVPGTLGRPAPPREGEQRALGQVFPQPLSVVLGVRQFCGKLQQLAMLTGEASGVDEDGS